MVAPLRLFRSLLEYKDGPVHLGPGEGQWLAGFGGQEPGQLFLPLGHAGPNPAQGGGARVGGQGRRNRRRLHRIIDRAYHLAPAGQVYLADH
jgi:hypothetical protein